MIPTFQELKKLANADHSGFDVMRVALLGDMATQFLAQAIRGEAHRNRLHLDLFEAPYDQIDALSLDPGSELYAHAPEVVIFYMSVEKVYSAFCACETPDGFAKAYEEKIQGHWDRISAGLPCKLIQFTFAEADDAVFGNYAGKTERSFLYQLRKLNLMLMDGTQRHRNVFLADIASIQSRIGRRLMLDERFLYSAQMAFSLDALPLVASAVVQVLGALRGRIKKCAVLDLDNTIWGGIVGDDGIGGIQLGELGAGKAFSDLQRWLKLLSQRGILLAVCSKNNEDIAKEPFEKHPDMILRLEDIALFVANWEDKASNIRHIQKTLNIGMDSLVFIDDNPFERELVRNMLPEVTVPDLPEDPALYLSFLQGEGLFETASVSEADAQRTGMYRAQTQRMEAEKNFPTLDDYLISLEMQAEAKPFSLFYYPRISQLTQRSNQFNLRTVRYTEAEIERFANDPDYATLYFTLKDRFGDYGLISVAILKRIDTDTFFIDTWIMSCRVLKRGVEEFVINKIIDTAEALRAKRVIGEYIRTPKNAMVESIYEHVGFLPVGDTQYQAEISGFTRHKIYIKERTDE